MELSSPTVIKLLIFKEGTFQARKTKIYYISLSKVVPIFLDDC